MMLASATEPYGDLTTSCFGPSLSAAGRIPNRTGTWTTPPVQVKLESDDRTYWYLLYPGISMCSSAPHPSADCPILPSSVKASPPTSKPTLTHVTFGSAIFVCMP
ncbi:hypothetical protein XPA_004819 [Xanthoria parietina]